MKNLASKRREIAKPYASWEDPASGWNYWLLKSHQADNGKNYARWFMWVEGDASEYGDCYVGYLLGQGGLSDAHQSKTLTVDTTIWKDAEAFMQWAEGVDATQANAQEAF